MNAAAVVAEGALASKEVVANFIELFNGLLFHVAFVYTTTVLTEAATASGVVTADFGGDIGVFVTRGTRLASAGAAATTSASRLRFTFDMLSGAVLAESTSATTEVVADLYNIGH